MTYSVKEIYYTLHGEGGQAGRAAVFLRFTGCNLWTGVTDRRNEARCFRRIRASDARSVEHLEVG
jgi:7-carboxy-7-deazaguanine synthase